MGRQSCEIYQNSEVMECKTKVRQSNIELLRILSMLGVIVNHALQSCYELHTADFSMANHLRIVVMDASIVAVNCFVFISGYFRIRQSWKGLFGLYTELLFYAVVSFVAGCFLSEDYSIRSGLTTIIFPITANGMWFIPVYFALWLMAPLLNAALDHQDRRGRRMTLLLLLLIDVYIGYMHQVEEISVNGYHLIHFVTLYYLGANLKEFEKSCTKWGGYFYCLSSPVRDFMLSKWFSRPSLLSTLCATTRRM